MCSNVAPAPSARPSPSLRPAGSERRTSRTVTGPPGPRRSGRAAPPPSRPGRAAPAGTPAAPRSSPREQYKGSSAGPNAEDRAAPPPHGPRTGCRATGLQTQRYRRKRETRRSARGFGGRRTLTRTWLQVMNSLVWVSSTSVQSLLRKAGTFELCFIVNQAQGFQILYPNAAVAAAAAAPGERPQRRRSGSRAPPPNLARRSARRGGPEAARDRQVSALACAHWSRAGLVPGQSRTPTQDRDKRLDTADVKGVGAEGGRCLLIRLLYKSLHCSGLLA